MSLDYFEFKNENGETAFLGGVVSHAADELDKRLYDLGVEYEAFAADIFYIGENNQIKFEESIKCRLENIVSAEYKSKIDVSLVSNLNNMKLNLQCAHESTLSDIIMNMYSNIEVNCERIRAVVEEFSKDIEYYLSKPIDIYCLPTDTNKEIYKCGGILSEYYTYIPFCISIIEYKKYILIVVRGTNE